VAQALLRAANVPIAAPSANTFGHISPTTAEHVLADLDGRIDAVLDGGATDVGLESTVAEARGDEVVIYRPGGVSLGEIESVVGSGTAWVHVAEDSAEPPASLPSPGVGIRHYAPRARLVLVREDFARSRGPVGLSLVETIDEQAANGAKVGVMLPDEWNASCADAVFRWGPWHRPEVLARRLYTGLRELDDLGCTLIVCPLPTSDGIATAIRDRLQKAAKS
jgi:L-threonylcarbamoyladenylate synthase